MLTNASFSCQLRDDVKFLDSAASDNSWDGLLKWAEKRGNNLSWNINSFN